MDTPPPRVRVGIDVGGTFTDLVALVGASVVTAKVPSTPADPSVAVLRVLEAAGLERWDVLAHGTTVATNALLERRGARVALVTTEGFRDVLEIGRQARPSLYDLTAVPPPPLVPRERRLTVRERTGPDGVVLALEPASVQDAVAAVGAAGVEAVAVCLLFGPLHPEHERCVGAALGAALPDVPVSLSCDVLPELREFERSATTVADAYLSPVLGRYLRRLAGVLGDASDRPAPVVMGSSGGVAPLAEAAAHAAAHVLSGPAGGVVGAAFVARAAGVGDALAFDMGGTSTDVAPILGGVVQTTSETVIAGVPVRLPTVDVHTVSAGGGSVAWVDSGGVLRVGPHSAGADPGPAAYGRGGTEPTVTDADLVLGVLADGTRLGGEVVLDRARAAAALARVGAALGLDAVETALGVRRVAHAGIVGALRVVSVERGLDPRELALLAYGGAGGMHACAVAEELGVARILLPTAGGVLSALGLAVADRRRDHVRAHRGLLDDDPEALEDAFRRLEEEARRAVPGAELRRRADLRYRGQSFELTVDGGEPDALGAAFGTAHEARYGWRADDPVEVVAVRVVAVVRGSADIVPAADDAAQAAGDTASASRPVRLPEGWADVPVLRRRALVAGTTLVGPLIVELPSSTLLVATGWSGPVDHAGTAVLQRA